MMRSEHVRTCSASQLVQQLETTKTSTRWSTLKSWVNRNLCQCGCPVFLIPVALGGCPFGAHPSSLTHTWSCRGILHCLKVCTLLSDQCVRTLWALTIQGRMIITREMSCLKTAVNNKTINISRTSREWQICLSVF